MKTAEEILTKVLNEWDNPDELDLMTILAKRSLPFMQKAMEEYALQFIHPKDCYQCDGTGTVIFPSEATQQCMICNGTGKLIILPMQKNT